MQHFRSKVIENLAVVNYDTNNLILAPYDWRLTPYNLEERDGYFSRLKSTIESFKLRILLFFWSLRLFGIYLGLSGKNREESVSLRHIQWAVLCVVRMISFTTENLR